MKRASEEEVHREITALGSMDVATRRQRWWEFYGRHPPARIREVLLRRGIAYQLQVLAFGGLEPATVRHLTRSAKELCAERVAQNGERVSLTRRPPKPLPGTQLVREWRGAIEVVEVTRDGFAWLCHLLLHTMVGFRPQKLC